MGCGSSKSEYTAAGPAEDEQSKPENKGGGDMDNVEQLNEVVAAVEKDIKENAPPTQKTATHAAVLAEYQGAVSKKKKKKSNIIFTHEKVDIYRSQTGFEKVELSALYETLKEYMTENEKEKIGPEDFISQCVGLKIFVDQENIARHLFTALDSSGDGFLDIGEIMTGLSIFATGTKESKFKVCFSAYDNDGDGGVTKAEMSDLMRSYVQASLKAVSSALEFEMLEAAAFGKDPAKAELNIEDDEKKFKVHDDKANQEQTELTIMTPVGEVTLFLNKKNVTDEEKDPYVRMEGDEFLEKLVKEIFAKYDRSEDGIISYDEFHGFVKEHRELTEWFGYLD